MKPGQAPAFLPVLTGLIVASIALPTVALSWWLAGRASSDALGRAETQAQAQAAAEAVAIEGRLSAPVQSLLWLALSPEVQGMLGGNASAPGAAEAMQAFLRRQGGGLVRAVVHDAAGRLIGGWDLHGRPLAADAHNEGWFVGAVSELAIPGGQAPVHIELTADQEAPRLSYACAIVRRDNTIVGVAMVESVIGAALAGRLSAGGRLLDRDGRTLAGEALAGEAVVGSATVRIPGSPAVHWRLEVAVPRDRALAGVRRAQVVVASATLLAMLIAAATAWWAASRVVRPLARLAEQMAGLGSGSLDGPIDLPRGPAEVARIAEAAAALRDAALSRGRELAENAERLRVVAEFAADWELWTAPDGGVLHCSPSCRDIAGIEAVRFLADPELIWSLVDTTDRAGLRQALAAAGYERAEVVAWRLRRNDGGLRWIEQIVRRVRGADGAFRGWRSTLRDVTQRRELEQRLAHAQRVQEIGQLAGGVAHDFNNLLAVIGGQADLLRRSPGQLDRLERIATAVGRGAALTRQLLMLSRRQVSDLVAIELGEAVRETVDLLRRTIGEGIQVEVDARAQVWAVLDRAEFGQVVMNLAINARDAMPGGGRLAIAVGPVAGADGRTWAELTVADSGTGMDQETLERIFQPYFTTKEAGKGTGLGLATAQAVVERGGGSISVTSAPGQGTVFTVLLPAAQTPRKPSSQEVRAAVELSGLRVLVAEDDEVLRELVRDGLVAAGAEVCLAGDGMAAVDAVAAGFSPAVAVLDVRMPRLGGIAALAALRRRIPDLPAVLMTGYAGESHAEVRAVVASRLLAKPFAIDELLAAVRDLAGSRTAGDAQRQDLHG